MCVLHKHMVGHLAQTNVDLKKEKKENLINHFNNYTTIITNSEPTMARLFVPG